MVFAVNEEGRAMKIVILGGPPKARLIFFNREVSKSWKTIA
jgi:hypothetical protein